MSYVPVEIVEADPGEAIGSQERKVRVTGRTTIDRDGKKVTFVRYNIVPLTALVFVDGQWQVDSEHLPFNQVTRVAINWGLVRRAADVIDVPFTVETELLALPDKS